MNFYDLELDPNPTYSKFYSVAIFFFFSSLLGLSGWVAKRTASLMTDVSDVLTASSAAASFSWSFLRIQVCVGHLVQTVNQ